MTKTPDNSPNFQPNLGTRFVLFFSAALFLSSCAQRFEANPTPIVGGSKSPDGGGRAMEVGVDEVATPIAIPTNTLESNVSPRPVEMEELNEEYIAKKLSSKYGDSYKDFQNNEKLLAIFPEDAKIDFSRVGYLVTDEKGKKTAYIFFTAYSQEDNMAQIAMLSAGRGNDVGYSLLKPIITKSGTVGLARYEDIYGNALQQPIIYFDTGLTQTELDEASPEELEEMEVFFIPGGEKVSGSLITRLARKNITRETTEKPTKVAPTKAEISTPKPAFEWKSLPDTPQELQANAITTEELVKLVGSDDQGEIMKWLKEQAEQKMDEVNKNWGDKPRANGLATRGSATDQGLSFLVTSLDKKVSTREQMPIQVLGVQMIEGESPNVFFPAEWGAWEKFFKQEQNPVLVQLGILTNVKDENGNLMTLTVTGITNDYSIFRDPKKAGENWDKFQTCLSDDGGEVSTIGFTFGNATGDGLGNGFMKALAFNFDKNGTLLSENSVGKRWIEAGNTGVPSDPHFRALKTPEDVRHWQMIFDGKGPFPMFRVTPGVFNEYKAK